MEQKTFECNRHCNYSDLNIAYVFYRINEELYIDDKQLH